MLQARIAGHNVRLHGCESMPCAQYVPLFAPYDGEADFTVEVTTPASLALPTHLPCERVGDWRIVRLPDDTTVVCHRGGGMMLTASERFEQVSLQLREDMTDRDTVQYLQVVQAFSYYLQHHGGCLLHSAGIRIGDNGIVLCGRSGVGKSTLARLLAARCPTLQVLSDDVSALTETNDGITLHGTPFCGKDTLCADAAAPLRAVILLRQAPQDRLYTPSADDIVYDLLEAVPRPVYARDIATLATDRLLRLMQSVPIYRFENTGTSASAQYLLRELSKHGIILEKVG